MQLAVPILPAELPPGRCAVRRGDLALDYETLRARALELAGALSLEPAGTLVAIRIGNEPAFLAALLACLAARRAAVLIDPLWTEAELRAVAPLIDPTLLVQTAATPRAAEAAAAFGAARCDLDEAGRMLACGRAERATLTPLFDVALVHFSSGSTGRPKPIAISPGALEHRLKTLALTAPFRPDDRTLCVLPLSHCHGIECLALPTLAAGAELVLLDPLAAGAETVARAVRERAVTIFSALPRLYSELLQAEVPQADLCTLRLPISGSAALQPGVARAFAGRFGVRILQGYGVTEIGVISLNQHAADPARFDSVGPALAGIEWRLAETDAEGVGELCVRSPGLASDADGRFESGRRTEDGWLRTGDLVRADADGYLYVLGRRGAVLNVNGAKADPGEIERVIETLPWVAECAVKGMLDERGAERIVAFVAARPGMAVRFPAEDVQRCVAESLSLFKVPARVHVLDALPRTSLGKIAYAALGPPPAPPGPAEPPLAPRGELERAVAELWCEVLRLPRVGVRDGFTSLGGNSVLLAELLLRLRERFGCELSIIDLFRHPTVEDQARVLAGGGPKAQLDEDGAHGDVLVAARARARRQGEQLLRRRPLPGGSAPVA